MSISIWFMSETEPLVNTDLSGIRRSTAARQTPSWHLHDIKNHQLSLFSPTKKFERTNGMCVLAYEEEGLINYQVSIINNSNDEIKSAKNDWYTTSSCNAAMASQDRRLVVNRKRYIWPYCPKPRCIFLLEDEIQPSQIYYIDEAVKYDEKFTLSATYWFRLAGASIN